MSYFTTHENCTQTHSNIHDCKLELAAFVCNCSYRKRLFPARKHLCFKTFTVPAKAFLKFIGDFDPLRLRPPAQTSLKLQIFLGGGHASPLSSMDWKPSGLPTSAFLSCSARSEPLM